MATTLPRNQYAAMYGPTTGDRVRLADTDLFIEVERDLTFAQYPDQSIEDWHRSHNLWID